MSAIIPEWVEQISQSVHEDLHILLAALKGVMDSAPCGPLQPHPHARLARLWHWLVICARSWTVNYQR